MFPRRQLAVARFKLVEVKTSFERENEECEMAHERIIFVPLMVGKLRKKFFSTNRKFALLIHGGKLCIFGLDYKLCVSAVVELLQLILYRLGNFPKVS
jgi:hypothetical protein